MTIAMKTDWIYYHLEDAGEYWTDLEPEGARLRVVTGPRPLTLRDFEDGELPLRFSWVDHGRWLCLRDELRQMDVLEP